MSLVDAEQMANTSREIMNIDIIFLMIPTTRQYIVKICKAYRRNHFPSKEKRICMEEIWMRMPGAQSVDATLDELFEKLSAMSIMSEPIDLEGRIIIPVIKISMAFGAGTSPAAKDEMTDGPARPVAGGASGLSPVAVMDISKTVSGQEGVRVVSIPSSEGSASCVAHEVIKRLISQMRTP